MIDTKKPNSRRKHRLFIDVTFSSPITPRDAAKGLQLVLDNSDIDKRPVWSSDGSPYISKLNVVEPNPNALSATLRDRG